MNATIVRMARPMPEVMPLELKVLANHIYELQKGVRQMVLFTCPKQYEANSRLRRTLSSVRCWAMTSVHNANAIVNVSARLRNVNVAIERRYNHDNNL